MEMKEVAVTMWQMAKSYPRSLADSAARGAAVQLRRYVKQRRHIQAPHGSDMTRHDIAHGIRQALAASHPFAASSSMESLRSFA